MINKLKKIGKPDHPETRRSLSRYFNHDINPNFSFINGNDCLFSQSSGECFVSGKSYMVSGTFPFKRPERHNEEE